MLRAHELTRKFYSRCRYTLVAIAEPARLLHKYARAVSLPFLTIRFVIVYHAETSAGMIAGERRTRCVSRLTPHNTEFDGRACRVLYMYVCVCLCVCARVCVCMCMEEQQCFANADLIFPVNNVG